MSRRPGIVLALLLSGPLGAAETAKAPAAAAPVSAKGLTKAQFDALPPTAVLEVKGKTFTVAELRALAAKNAASRAGSLELLKGRGKASLEAARAKFRASEKSRVEAANAGLRPAFAALAGPHANVALSPAAVNALKGTMPSIASVQGTVEPGALVHITGQNFGAPSGKVLLKGLPGGDRALTLDAGTPGPWGAGAIAAVVPEIEGVLDQQVTLVVVTKDGLSSAAKPVAFKAALDVDTAYPITITKCGKDATEDACLSFDFFEGHHIEDTLWETDGIGCDEFKGVAKLPWTFDSFVITDMSHGGSIGHPGAVRNGDSYVWQVCWTVDGAGPYSGHEAYYLGYLMIKGPKGVKSF